jgi:methylated-DNA-[protein]-cysteine S-methyltransferase
MKPPLDSFTVDSAVTSLAVTAAGGAVTRIDLNKRGSRPPKNQFERRVARELRDYFLGKRRSFTFPVRPAGSDFNQRVWQELARIPYGETCTYGELARKIGRSKAARAVGTANRRNPIPIVLPCHRVVAAGGKLGGYGGGLELKRKLLELEGRYKTVEDGGGR